jgi:hypothetical protein
MTEAYELTLKTLDMKDREDPLTEIIAQTIIAIAQTNERDPARISTLAIEQLGASPRK